MQPGRYKVSARAEGFKERIETGLVLAAGQRLRAGFTLEVGNVTESVTVEAAMPILNTVNAEQRETLATERLRELPSHRRDWTAFLKLGTSLAIKASEGQVSMNGLAPSGFALTIDGTEANGNPELQSFSLMNNPNFIKGVSLEAIAEVNVTKGIASAENAPAMSGNVNLITRSGTNELHGSLFENYQTGGLNARNQFLTTVPKSIFHQFGGSAGGPVVRNKLFFFGVYEGYRLNSYSLLSGNVATKEFREQAIAAQPAYKAFFDEMPLPTQPYPAGALSGLYQAAGTSKAKDDHFVVRGDYHASSHDLLKVRFTRGEPYTFSPRVFARNSRQFITSTTALSSSYTHVFTAATAETRVGFLRNRVDRLDGFYTLNLPVILTNLGFGATGAQQKLLGNYGKTFSFEEILAVTRGRHSLKFGGLFSYNTQSRDTASVPEITYTGAADFLANIPSQVSFDFGVQPPYLLRFGNYGAFIQDDFKVNSRLVLNLGMRWDCFSVPRERDKRLFNREGPFGFGAFRDPDSALNADRNNFSPRIGFAWTADRSGKTVIRAGAGQFYSRIPIVHVLFLVKNAPDEPTNPRLSRTEALAAGVRYPIVNTQALPLFKGARFPWTGDVLDPNARTPLSLQWTFSIQRQLTPTLALETAYVGNRGANLVITRRQNMVDRLTGQRPVTGFGEFPYADGSDSSVYHGWQTSLRKRFSKELSYNLHYTWSRVLSYGEGDLYNQRSPQDINNIRADRGPAPLDARQRLISDFVYELPVARLAGGFAWSKLLFTGWQVTGIFSAETGSPLNLSQSSSVAGARPDYVGGNPYADGSDRLQYLNRAAFVRVPVIPVSGAAARPGTLGRNALFGPGFWNLDAALSKNLRLREGWNLQLRADMFNALNHTNFSGVQTSVEQANFGRFTSTRGARLVQLNARFTF